MSGDTGPLTMIAALGLLWWFGQAGVETKLMEKTVQHLKSINNKIPNNLQGSTSMTTSSSSSHPKNIFVGGRMIGMSTSTTTSSSASHPQGMYRTY